MKFKPIAGGCLCGNVRYELLEGAKSIEHCHCSMCRRAHGALFASGGVFNHSAVRITQGEGNLQSYESSAGNYRQFCQTCGCHLFMTVDHIPHEIYVWVASLDEGAHPGHPADKEAHILIGSKASWEDLEGKIPQYENLCDSIGIGLEAK